jgi:hypothetical protein
MSTPRKNATDTRGKPFAPGNRGRPRGARNKVTRAIEKLLDGEAEALTRKAVERALAGDTTALRLCLDRIAPPRKDAPISVALPAVRTATDALAASAALLEAVSVGQVTPDEAGRVMALLSAHKALIETCELEVRITALEARP